MTQQSPLCNPSLGSYSLTHCHRQQNRSVFENGRSPGDGCDLQSEPMGSGCKLSLVWSLFVRSILTQTNSGRETSNALLRVFISPRRLVQDFVLVLSWRFAVTPVWITSTSSMSTLTVWRCSASSWRMRAAMTSLSTSVCLSFTEILDITPEQSCSTERSF